jgi:hypothetical protein
VGRGPWQLSNDRLNVDMADGAYEGSWEMWALRDIEAGEELFTSYRAAYWLDQLLRTHPDPTARLILYLYLIK